MHPNTTTTTPLNHSLPAIVVHRALRREVRLAGPLVRAVAAGDLDRARVVGDHLDLVMRMLHHHHETEDDLVWPPLRERLGADLLPIVALMEEQHERIVVVSDAITEQLAVWVRTADVAAGRQLATLFDDLHVTLDEHLDIEEREVLPLSEDHLTTEEWEELGRQGEQGFSGRERTLVLGILEYEADPAVLASMLGAAPLPVRVLVPKLGRRAYRRHAVAVHGTPNP